MKQSIVLNLSSLEELQLSLSTRYQGRRALFCKIADIFLTSYPEQLDELKAAVLNTDAENVQQSAHKIKGSIAQLSQGDAYKTALNLEFLGRQNALEKAIEEYQDLEALLIAFESDLHVFIDSEVSE